MPRYYVFRDLWEADWLPWCRRYVLDKLAESGPDKLHECLRNDHALRVAGAEAWSALRDHKLAIGCDGAYVASWRPPYGWDWGPRLWVHPMKKLIRVRITEFALAPAPASSLPRFELPCPTSHSGFHMFVGFIDDATTATWLAHVRIALQRNGKDFEPSHVERRATADTSGSKRGREEENHITEDVEGVRFVSSATPHRFRVKIHDDNAVVERVTTRVLPDGAVVVGQEPARVNAICFDRSMGQLGGGGDEEGPMHYDVSPSASASKTAKIFIALEHGACVALRGRATKNTRRIFIPVGAALVVSGDVAHAFGGSLDPREAATTILYLRASIDADVAKSVDDASVEGKKFFALDDAA